MLPWLSGDGSADPGRVHTEGRMARSAVEDARQRVADLLGARPRQVIFTSGATESVNAAVWGAIRSRPGLPIVCARVEHSCVRDASERLAEVLEVGVDNQGHIDLDHLESLLAGTGPDGGGETRPPALVHCQVGNHEVGTLQAATEAAALCRARGILCHADAAAAAGHVPFDVASLGADMVSVSAHKMGGPKGAGALVLRTGLRIEPLLVGGEQERARRAGMENTPRSSASARSPRSSLMGAASRSNARGPGPRPEGSWSLRPRSKGSGCSAILWNAFPKSPAWASRALWRRECSSAWIRPGSPRTPGRPARRSRSPPRRCSRQWGSRQTSRFGSPSVGPLPMRTSTCWRRPSPRSSSGCARWQCPRAEALRRTWAGVVHG